MARVLVVDDDRFVRQLFELALRGAQHEVTCVNDAPAAHRELGQGRYDAVVLDIQMPGESGSDLLRAMRAAGNQTPVVVVTAGGTSHVNAVLRELGEKLEVVQKPIVELSTLVEAVARAMAPR